MGLGGTGYVVGPSVAQHFSIAKLSIGNPVGGDESFPGSDLKCPAEETCQSQKVACVLAPRYLINIKTCLLSITSAHFSTSSQNWKKIPLNGKINHIESMENSKIQTRMKSEKHFHTFPPSIMNGAVITLKNAFVIWNIFYFQSNLTEPSYPKTYFLQKYVYFIKYGVAEPWPWSSVSCFAPIWSNDRKKEIHRPDPSYSLKPRQPLIAQFHCSPFLRNEDDPMESNTPDPTSGVSSLWSPWPHFFPSGSSFEDHKLKFGWD